MTNIPNNVVNIFSFKIDKTYVLNVENKTIGLSETFVKEVSVEHLEFLHNLNVKHYFGFKNININSLDHYIDSYEAYMKYLTIYYK